MYFCSVVQYAHENKKEFYFSSRILVKRVREFFCLGVIYKAVRTSVLSFGLTLQTAIITQRYFNKLFVYYGFIYCIK